MKSSLKTLFRSNPYLPPWIISGTALILLVVVLAAAVQDFRRQKAHMKRILTEKGAALIKALEAGARTGMMGMRWGNPQIQILLEQTARLPDVRYLVIFSLDGKVVAHSDPAKVGSTMSSLPVELSSGHLDPENGQLTSMPPSEAVFEVYRPFKPLMGRGGHRFRQKGMGRRHGHRMGGQPQQPPGAANAPFLILVGLDMSAF